MTKELKKKSDIRFYSYTRDITRMLEQLENIVKPKNRGAKPSFTVIEIIRLIRIVGKNGLISRAKLAEELGVGEGTIRTIVTHLKKMGIIKVIRSGISLERKGIELFHVLDKAIVFESFCDKKLLADLALGDYNYLLILRDKADKIKKGIEERDIAIRFGTKALITLVYRSEGIEFPDGYPLGEEYKEFKSFLKKETTIEKGDVILLSCGDRRENTINGAYSVLYHLLK
ncbi:MAG TPA: DUF4443 domain-containing protein [Geobacterales bacterium]|nr:DUF4443 domain-containing protein [Geobacterales bacterium]